MDPVLDFLHSDGVEDDLFTLPDYPTIYPCGHGQFLFEVMITTEQLKEADTRDGKNYLSWKLCLFSNTANSIVWSLELDQFSSKCSPKNVLMSCVRRSSLDHDTQATSDFSMWDCCSGKLLLGQVFCNGTVNWNYSTIQVPIPFDTGWDFEHIESDLSSTYLEKDTWEYYQKARYLVDTPTDIIMSYVKKQHTVNCFYRKNADGTIAETCTEIPLTENLLIINKPSRIRESYVAFVCVRCDDGVITTVVIHGPSRI
jgi:hypothetical protein